MSDKRLIETAFPLAEASAASLHEKNMRHGHISTLHLWPARRPLAASRAAIAAALLPDPGDDEARNWFDRLGGGLEAEEADQGGSGEERSTSREGGGRRRDPVVGPGKPAGYGLGSSASRSVPAHGGRAPRLLDPFAGGGAIPLEAMRLGCELVANDLNPVAWFILKCTLEYPQLLAGQALPLPPHAMNDSAFATAFLKSQGLKGTWLDQAVVRMTAIGRDEKVQDDLLADADRPWERAGSRLACACLGELGASLRRGTSWQRVIRHMQSGRPWIQTAPTDSEAAASATARCRCGGSGRGAHQPA